MPALHQGQVYQDTQVYRSARVYRASRVYPGLPGTVVVILGYTQVYRDIRDTRVYQVSEMHTFAGLTGCTQKIRPYINDLYNARQKEEAGWPRARPRVKVPRDATFGFGVGQLWKHILYIVKYTLKSDHGQGGNSGPLSGSSPDKAVSFRPRPDPDRPRSGSKEPLTQPSSGPWPPWPGPGPCGPVGTRDAISQRDAISPHAGTQRAQALD